MRFISHITFIIVLILLTGAADIKAQPGYAASSKLSSGKWLKLGVTKPGIYRIDYSRLRQAGMDYPANPHLYGNNFGQLSYYNTGRSPDDLNEIAVMLVKGTDGVFNEGDYLLFYADATNRWDFNKTTGKYNFRRHNYSDTAFYFLTSSQLPAKEIGEVSQPVTAANYTSTSYDALYIHEYETENLIKSGREWYQPVSTLSAISINPSFTDLMPGEPVYYSVRVLARSSIPTMFRLYEGATVIESILVPEVNLLSTTGTYARDIAYEGSITPSSATPLYEVKFYNNGEQGARGWLDYLKLSARSLLTYSGKTLEFSDSRTVQPGRVTEFVLKSSSSNLNIWEISDPFSPGIIKPQKTGDENRFRINTDSLRKFIAFSPENILTPVFRTSPVTNQDLHGSQPAGMVIVTHPVFRKYATQLATLHNENSGLETIIVTPEEIYNEYSGGIPDIAAIRNFLRMKYLKQNNTATPLRYLLLFGDGSFENKTLPPKNPNFVPTYQSQNSTVIVSSFTSDDFYGLLEDGEGEADGTEDIGIGRFPVSDTTQAAILVDKVRKYMSSENTGNWKNMIAITADDEDGNTHMNDAEGLYQLLNSTYPDFNIDKIYLDAYRQSTSVNGQSYPDVTSAINDRINAGCLIFDYLGHGNEIGLAHERVVKTENINSWRNGAKLPLFITATCEFSRFDDVDISPINHDMTGKTSAGELVILNPGGGAIALMTTTRVVYSAPNYTLNRNILNFAFRRDIDGSALALGDIIKLAKQNSGSGMNKRNFLLLGDPALRLAYPWHGEVITDSINGRHVSQPSDTLKALSRVTISGHVEDNGGSLLSGFDGVIYPVVYDKTSRIKTLANDGGQVMEFDLRNSILFSGKAEIKDGKFSFSFIVPRDIDYAFGPGKISYYASRGNEDMGGSWSQFITGGFSNSIITDTAGPGIRIFLNDTLFRNGGICDPDPVLLALIEDPGGINTTGTGIGHDLTGWLDNDRNRTVLLNSYFETDLNDFRSGRLTYPLSGLDGGDHSITIRAWDNYNNSSTETIKFVVRTEEGIILTNLINYPNPFINETDITAGHNRPDEELNIRISIYNMNGQLVRIIESDIVSSGYRLPPVHWDGTDNKGSRVGRGMYIYTVAIRTSKGETARASGRMIIL